MSCEMWLEKQHLERRGERGRRPPTWEGLTFNCLMSRETIWENHACHLWLMEGPPSTTTYPAHLLESGSSCWIPPASPTTLAPFSSSFFDTHRLSSATFSPCLPPCLPQPVACLPSAVTTSACCLGLPVVHLCCDQLPSVPVCLLYLTSLPSLPHHSLCHYALYQLLAASASILCCPFMYPCLLATCGAGRRRAFPK